MKKILVNELGKIDISMNVISTIAGQTALGCYGLSGMTARKIHHGLAKLLGRSHLGKGVDVLQTGEGKIIINLYVAVEYGAKVSEVCDNLMRRVKYEVENTTGLLVEKVNVHIQGVRNSEIDNA